MYKRTHCILMRYLLALLLPVMLFGAVMMLNRVTPFGNRTLLIWDANTQYIDFFAYFREAMLGKQNILYTLSKGIGGSLFGLFAYYLASPLNLLLLLFSDTTLPLGFSMLVWLKVGLCGVTAYHFYNSGRGGSAQNLFFSTTFALTGYVAAYFWDVMWMDGVILLPLIALGIRRIVVNKTPWAFTVWLAVGLIANFYIGFMLCLFSVLYFIYCLLTDDDRPYRQSLQLSLRFAAASLLAGGIGAAVLVPAAIELFKEYGVGGSLSWTFNFSLKDLPVKWMTASVDYQQLKNGLPNLYVGIPVLALFFWYFTRACISVKKRIAAAVMVLIWILSFWVDGINLFWHGMDKPNFFPYRYSFLLSFFMIETAWQGWQATLVGLVDRDRAPWLLLGVSVLGYFLMILLKGRTFLAPWTIVFDIVVWVASVSILYIVLRKGIRSRRIAFCSLFILQISCIIINGQQSMERIQDINSTTTVGYANDTTVVHSVISQLRADYDANAGISNRIEKDFYRTPNDALHFGYAGLSHFSSNEDKDTISFLGKLGLRDAAGYAYYNRGTTIVNDTVLGVRYLLSKKTDITTSYPLYVRLFSTGDLTVLENPDAFPLAISAGKPVVLASDDPFINQNTLFEAITGASDVFEPITDIQVDRAGVAATSTNQYMPKTVGEDAVLVYHIPAQAGEYIYASLGGWPLNVYVTLDGQPLDVYDADALADCALLPVLEKSGEHVLAISAHGSFQMDPPLFYRLNRAVYQRGIAKTNASKFSVAVRHDTISIQVDGGPAQVLLVTIPYDRNWEIRADGISIQPTAYAGALLSLPIPEGTNEVVLHYHVEGFQFGVMVSCASLLAFLCWILIQTQRHHLKREKG